MDSSNLEFDIEAEAKFIMDKLERVTGYHVLFVGGDDEDMHVGLIGGDQTLALAFGVSLLIENDAERLKAGKYHAAHLLAVLTDACGKDDGINTAHDHDVLADILLDGVGVHLVCQHSALITELRSFTDASQIVGDTGDSEQAGLLVHKVVNLVRAQTFVLHEERHDRRVDRSATRTHHETVKGSHAHGRVNGDTVVNRRD